MKLKEALETIKKECESHKHCEECQLRIDKPYGLGFTCFFSKNPPEDWDIGAVMEGEKK